MSGNMGKSFALVFAVLMVFLLVAGGCSSDSATTTQTTVAPSSTETTAAATTSTSASDQTSKDSAAASMDALLTRVFGTTDVDPVVKEVLSYASEPYTDAEKALAIQAYKEGSVETGHGDLTVAFHNGYTDNSWMNEVVMNFILQAIRYPEVGKIVVTRAGGDSTKALSDLRALIVQKPDIIVSLHALGPAALPTFKEAMDAGIVLVPFNAETGGVVGEDMSAEVKIDWAAVGMANIIVDETGSEGKVAIILGPAGFPPEVQAVEAMMGVFAEHPGIEVLPPVNTDWTAESVFTATSSLLARYPEIDAIYQSFGDAQRGAIRAYHQANRPLDIVTVHHNVTNGLYKDWIDEGNPNYRMYVSTGGNWGSRLALHMGLLLKTGKPGPTEYSIPFDMLPADPKYYDPTLPESFNPHGTVPGDVVTSMYAE